MLQVNFPFWTPSPVDLDLPKQSIHIWSIRLDVADSNLHQFAQTLSPDEQQRSERFRFERDRHRYIVGRGTLRAILGRYLNINPLDLQFSYSTKGKPALIAPAGSSNLDFNLSHSQNLMLCAIAQSTPVGIDLEYLRPVDNLLQLTQRFFAPQEHIAIQALPTEEQLQSFFYHWTCKEALLKATGVGVADLSNVEVSIENGVVKRIRWLVEPQHLNEWWVELFSPAPEYVAAIASSNSCFCNKTPVQKQKLNTLPLVFWQWQE
ncbi:MAG: 4'-phosphopantetheinyl transferase superfamily protein [Leptolyngbyaceae cyanobacterium CAN_BIN12]|nr:4'-phosphopantetheinyl transferase superfamily protein [Leptolyngbyaceae cyanobacterium CAN_BIN12]